MSVAAVAAHVGLFGLAAFALPALWWLRNFAVYGFPDVFGLGAHDRVVVGQLRTEALIAQVGLDAYLRSYFETTFNSFFGQLGWMALPMPAWVYALLLLALVAALLGWGIALLRSDRDERAAPVQRLQAVWLALAGGLALAQYVYYNSEFVQFQGRYLFTGLLPFALLTASGWQMWVWHLRWEEGGVLRAYAPFLLALLYVPLNLWLLWRVVPGLAAGV
jgi:hypothetical protein